MQAGCKQVRWGRYEGESLWKSSQLNKTCCRPPNGGELTSLTDHATHIGAQRNFSSLSHFSPQINYWRRGWTDFFLLLLVFGWACFSMLVHCCCILDLPPVSSQWSDCPVVLTTQFPELSALVSWVHVEGSLKEVTQSQHVITSGG